MNEMQDPFCFCYVSEIILFAKQEGSLKFDDVVYEIQPDTSADQTNGLPAHIVKERENQDEGE